MKSNVNIRISPFVAIVVIVEVIQIALGCLAYNWYQLHEKQQKAALAIAVQKADDAGRQAGFNSQNKMSQIFLNTCLNNVDSWYNENRQTVTTISQENALNDEKQQQIQECQIRNPK